MQLNGRAPFRIKVRMPFKFLIWNLNLDEIQISFAILDMYKSSETIQEFAEMVSLLYRVHCEH